MATTLTIDNALAQIEWVYRELGYPDWRDRAAEFHRLFVVGPYRAR